MRRIDTLTLSLSVATLSAAVYWLHPAGPKYYPLEHVWSWAALESPGMLWYARSAYSVVAAGGAALAAWAVSRFLRNPLGLVAVRTLTIVTLGGLALFIAALAWREFSLTEPAPSYSETVSGQ